MSYEISNLETHVLSTSTDTNKISELEETIEFLQSQIESLKQYLYHKNYEVQQIEQELDYTNKELCAALNVNPLTIDEAMELTKNLLASNKPTEDVLVELLIGIYGSTCGEAL